MNEEISKILSELAGSQIDIDFKQSFENGGIDNSIILAVMQNKRLNRIAEALEAIDMDLSEISMSLKGIDQNLDNCISRYNGNSFLCITGNVSTD